MNGKPETTLKQQQQQQQNGAVVVANGGGMVKEEEEEEEETMTCGWRGWRPQWLQACNNPKVFLLLLCWLVIVQGFTMSGIANVMIAAIERRYDLPSTLAALVPASYEVIAALACIPVTYYATNAHKPRILTFSPLLLSAGSFIMTIPHWAVGPYQLGKSISDTCVIGGNATDGCDVENVQSNLRHFVWLFVFGNAVASIGGSTIFTIGTVFLDENVSTRDAPLYVGIMHGMHAIGPAVGYVLGGRLLNVYVDVGRVDLSKVLLTPDDPRWVGAWWIGLIIGGTLYLTVSFFMSCYPKELPAARLVKAERVSQAHSVARGKESCNEAEFTSIREMPKALAIILKNPTYILIILGGALEAILISGFMSFMSKLLQNQFRQTSGDAATFAGMIAIPGAVLGQILGGWIPQRFGFKVLGMLRQAMVVALLSVAVCASFFIRCEPKVIAGVNNLYMNRSIFLEEAQIVHPCNEFCGCSTRSYEPVCGVDDMEYFSPCHAGCFTSKLLNGIKQYENCTCINLQKEFENHTVAALGGQCKSSCFQMYIFLPIFFFVIAFTFIGYTPGIALVLRVVPDKTRSFAVGIQWCVVKLLGAMPGPILFGAIMDMSCKLWQDNCGRRGSCWIYDTDKLATNLVALGMMIKALIFVIFLIAQFIYKPPVEEEKKPVANGGASIISSIELDHTHAYVNGGMVDIKYDEVDNTRI